MAMTHSTLYDLYQSKGDCLNFNYAFPGLRLPSLFSILCEMHCEVCEYKAKSCVSYQWRHLTRTLNVDLGEDCSHVVIGNSPGILNSVFNVTWVLGIGAVLQWDWSVHP